MNAKKITLLPDKTGNFARIRILATTDIHGHLLPYDYIKDQATQGDGLAGLASLIALARAQAEAAHMPVLLLDNGDTFQGTPLASYLAELEVGPDHPIVTSLNYLEYDALGLGNHDLDHGLPYLKAIAQELNMPIVNSNLRDIDLGPLRPNLLLTIPLGPDAPSPLTIGILSVLPIQSAAWNSHHLGLSATIDDPADTIAEQASELRSAGADLIVVLAHMGVGLIDGTSSDSLAAQGLVPSQHIDALVLGHTHRRLPSSDYVDRAGVDIADSTVGGVPAVMAGHAGSDLAVMDLELAFDADDGWRIHQHTCNLRPNTVEVAPDSTICTLADAQHMSVNSLLQNPVAIIPRDVHSYFSLVTPAPTQCLIARAHSNIIRYALAGTADAALPILATAAAHGAGGRDGLGNYVHIPKGQVLLRHVAGMIPFANQTVAIHITGAQISVWLEHAALVFNTLSADTPQQMLVNNDVPAFQFDTIFGLTYQINPTAAPFTRVSQISYDGVPINAAKQFVLATTQFRVAGGGGYVPISASRIITTSDQPVQDALIDTLNTPNVDPWSTQSPWRFAALGGTQAVLLTHPSALECLDDISHLQPQQAGTTPEGFIRLRVTL